MVVLGTLPLQEFDERQHGNADRHHEELRVGPVQFAPEKHEGDVEDDRRQDVEVLALFVETAPKVERRREQQGEAVEAEPFDVMPEVMASDADGDADER